MRHPFFADAEAPGVQKLTFAFVTLYCVGLAIQLLKLRRRRISKLLSVRP